MRTGDYLRKIGIERPEQPTVEALRRLHLAHRETFLFENLTIQKGGGISLRLEDIARKFLDEGAGGYCFEHNTLFAAILRDLGFAVTTLLGRVRNGPPERWVRTHMVLRVLVDGTPWLADVGYGGFGLLEPIRLADGEASPQGGATYSLRREAGMWVVSMQDRSAATDMYEFTEDPQTEADIEVANHYTATHPESRFRRTLTIQGATREQRRLIRGATIVRFENGQATEQAIDPSAVRKAVRDLFGIELPDTPLVFETYDTTI
jgi:N-hydroxyarylamine O-acetyltransferase